VTHNVCIYEYPVSPKVTDYRYIIHMILRNFICASAAILFLPWLAVEIHGGYTMNRFPVTRQNHFLYISTNKKTPLRGFKVFTLSAYREALRVVAASMRELRLVIPTSMSARSTSLSNCSPAPFLPARLVTRCSLYCAVVSLSAYLTLRLPSGRLVQGYVSSELTLNVSGSLLLSVVRWVYCLQNLRYL
jgi:hypothetical protein